MVLKGFMIMSCTPLNPSVRLAVRANNNPHQIYNLPERPLSEEKLPVSEKLAVIRSTTLYKTNKWWSAVVLLESFGRKQIAAYLWLNKSGKWKRQEKFLIHSKNEWEKIREAVEKFTEQLP